MKILSLFVMLVLVIGMMPLAFAENNDTETGSGNNDSGSEDAGNDDAPEPTLYGNERPEDAPPPRVVAARERMQNAAENAQQRMERARENYDAAKERYTQAREKYQEARGNVKEAREQVKECLEDDSEECDAVRQRVKTNAKPFLSGSAEMILSSLEKLAARIEESDMDEDVKAERLAAIEERIAEILAAQEVVEELGDDATAEEIAEATSEVRNAWGNTKNAMKVQAGHVVNEKLKHVHGQLLKLGERLERSINRLGEKGHDTSEAEALMAEYNEDLEKARAKYQEARQAYGDALNSGDVDEAVKAANEYVKEAHAELKQARERLREIVREIKGLSGDLSVVAESDDDADDDDSDDDGSEDEEDDTDDEDDSGDNETDDEVTE